MDLSKLPKLSNTPAPPPQEKPEATPSHANAPAPMPGLAEGWISLALGIILLLAFPNTWKYFKNPAAFDLHGIVDGAGNPIPYRQSWFFWPDLGVTMFAVVLLIEGVTLTLLRKRPALFVAFALTIGAVLVNIIAVAHAYSTTGFQIVNALAVAMGVYMAITQWRVIQLFKKIH